MIKEKTKKIAITSITIAVLSLVFYVVTIFLVLNIKSSLKSLRQEIANFSSEYQSMIAIKKLLESSEDDISKLNSYFVSRNGAVDFIEHVESLAKLSGADIDIGSVSVDSSLQKKDTEAIRMTVDFKGSWKEASSFLFLVENAPFKISIENARILKNESSGNWSGEMEFIALKLK